MIPDYGWAAGSERGKRGGIPGTILAIRMRSVGFRFASRMWRGSLDYQGRAEAVDDFGQPARPVFACGKVASIPFPWRKIRLFFSKRAGCKQSVRRGGGRYGSVSALCQSQTTRGPLTPDSCERTGSLWGKKKAPKYPRGFDMRFRHYIAVLRTPAVFFCLRARDRRQRLPGAGTHPEGRPRVTRVGREQPFGGFSHLLLPEGTETVSALILPFGGPSATRQAGLENPMTVSGEPMIEAFC